LATNQSLTLLSTEYFQLWFIYLSGWRSQCSRLDRLHAPDSIHFNDILESFTLNQHVTDNTHKFVQLHSPFHKKWPVVFFW